LNETSKLIDWQELIDEELIIAALSKSSKKYIVTSTNYLRLFKENNLGLFVSEEMPIVQAYLRFGANAIVEVLDYGSYNLENY
jgi:hypothetical protein